jgi:hypothetical protein
MQCLEKNKHRVHRTAYAVLFMSVYIHNGVDSVKVYTNTIECICRGVRLTRAACRSRQAQILSQYISVPTDRPHYVSRSRSAVHKLSKNTGNVSNFYAPDAWHETISTLWTRHCTKFSRHDDLTPGICKPLVTTAGPPRLWSEPGTSHTRRRINFHSTTRSA